MIKLRIIVLLLLTQCSCEKNEEMIINPYVFSSGLNPSNSVILIFDIGQSNSIGRAESKRYIKGTKYTEFPTGVKIFYKPDYASTDNGSFFLMHVGSYLTREPDQSSSFYFHGAYAPLANELAEIYWPQGTYVYIVAAGDGGTALEEDLTSPDWDPSSSGECFQTATEYYYAQAYTDVETENPGKTIIPLIIWHQGETDAADATARANYATNFSAFVTALRASHASLSSALLLITKLYYNADANESAINTVFQNYADANPTNTKIIDISASPRKIDLTSGQKYGQSATSSDDIHTSYLGQISKADQAFVHLRSKYPSIPAVPSEITTNTGYDPSVLSAAGVRLQCSRDNVTINSNNDVTVLANNLTTYGDFSVVNGTGTAFKVLQRKGWVFTPGTGILDSVGTARYESAAAIGSLYSNSFSFAAWVKPRDGRPPIINTFVHDVASTASPNNSRWSVYIDTAGKINVYYAVGGTAVTAITNSAIFPDNTPTSEQHLAVTFTSGGAIRIYIDGVLQAITGGDISALTMANYTNATNKTLLCARRSGVSTYDLYYFGMMREVMIQPVVYSTTDIANLMLN